MTTGQRPSPPVLAGGPHAAPHRPGLRPPPATRRAGSPHADPLRRTPSQDRSRIRVGRVLDAAGQLVADRGYEATTTSLIARRAGVSPGSFYQFFADKRAVVEALSARNLALFLDRLDATLLSRRHPDWWEQVEAALDVYIGLCREQPGFRAVRFGDAVEPDLAESAHDTVAAIRIAALLTSRCGVRATPDLRLALVTTLKVADALVRFAFARDPGGDEAVLAQARSLLHAHLARYVHTGR